MAEKVTIGDAVLYHGDCLEILPGLGEVDALVTDPPYGIGAYATGSMGGSVLARKSEYEPTEWDDKPASKQVLDLAISLSDEQVIFGGNYFDLPPSKCWLVWDKETGNNNFADAELAWTNIDGAVRLIRHRWQGMLRASEKKFPRVHPTQKPIHVMEWAITQFKGQPKTILDPFMGSGSTGIACFNLGLAFTGIEINRQYFDVACERIAAAYSQPRLFNEVEDACEQESFPIG